MKSLIKFFSVLLIGVSAAGSLHAQDTKADKKAAKIAEVKKIVNSINYVFVANFMYPQGGASRSLSGTYELTVARDKVVAYLPYAGRIYSAPIDASQGGIKLTSTNFVYKAKPNKKGGWDITIKPQEQSPSGAADVDLFRLSISNDGHASLMVTGNNREPISFDGDIVGPNPVMAQQ